MKKLLFFALLITGHLASDAQFSRYVIQLTNKAGSTFSLSNPLQFLSPRSVERRTKHNILIDQTDLPVTPAYIDSIRLAGNVTILNVSKWFNQVCILTTDATALTKINGFSFVISSSPISARTRRNNDPVNKELDGEMLPMPGTSNKPQNPANVYDYGLAYPQIHLHNAEFLHNLGFKGQGMQMAITDAGFYGYKTLPTFDSIRQNNQILGSWDFVANELSVEEDFVHGMNCLSTIAANLPGSFVGTAPETSFYLFRTEDIGSEYPIEEFNWVAAAERSDSLGVDIISVSLGYSNFDNSIFNHKHSDLNGNTALMSKAVDLAAKKGLLVVVAAGNEGNSSWKQITVPADADSALVVGAVGTAKQVAGFSGYGPSSDGQVKPDVAAVGVNTVVADSHTGGPVYSNGTSYACPIIAGISTCLWQAYPEVNNMAIVEALRKSSDHYNLPDNRTGYGIPDAKKAFILLLKQTFAHQIMVKPDCHASISLQLKAKIEMNVVVERRPPGEAIFQAVKTFQFTNDGFQLVNLTYTDDLSIFSPGSNVQYRFRMVIGKDTSFYLDSAVVTNGPLCGTSNGKINIGPNPVFNLLTITIAKHLTSKVAVLIHSISGQEVYAKTQQLNGVTTLSVPMKQMAAGFYLVTVYFDDKKELVRRIAKH